jgi:hypothetical protein
MDVLHRKDQGRPLREAMSKAGLTGPDLAAATRRVDPDGRGVSPALIGFLVGTGRSARDRCKARTGQLIAAVLDAPVHELFDMPTESTSTEDWGTPMATSTLAERAQVLAPLGLTPLLKQSELEAYYGVSDWTVNQWVQQGCPTVTTRFRGRRFDLSQVQAWMERGEQDSAAS